MARDARGRFISAGRSSGAWVTINTGYIAALVRSEGARRLNNCGELVVGFLREKMDSPKHGRTYRIPGTSETYVASAPGEYPAVRTGNLFLSLFAQKVGPTTIAIGTPVDYAKYLEGTPGGADGIRPFLRRAEVEAQPLIQQEMSRPWVLGR